MNTFLFWNKILVFIINGIGIYLAGWIYLSNPKRKLNKIFIWMVIFMVFWITFAYFARELGGSNNFLSLIYIKIAWFVTPLFFTFLYLLVISLIKKEVYYLLLTKFVVFFGSIASLGVILSDLVVKDIIFIGNLLRIIYGKGMLLFLIIISFLIIATLYVLIREYLKISLREKRKIEYFLAGILIFYSANIIFNIIFPLFFNISSFIFLGDYSAIFLLTFTAYAIVKRELFEIKAVLVSLFVGLIAVLLFLDIFIFTQIPFLQVIKGILLIIFLFFGYSLIKSVLREIKLREELQLAYKELKEIDIAKSEFISLASHQLRTPLTVIKGYLSMVLGGDFGQIPEEVREKLKNVFFSNERLIKIVNDLLDISKIELRKIEIEKVFCQPEELLQSCYEEMKIEAQKKGLKFFFEKPKTLLPKLNIDALKIRQAILNLIDNALKYTKKGEVEIKAEKKNSSVLISIRDTGEGLTPEEKKRIFGSFTRGEAGIAYWTEGAGLGLYIAKKFLEVHQGKIWVESSGKNKGSTFYIELPIK